jgi:CcmD family protein
MTRTLATCVGALAALYSAAAPLLAQDDPLGTRGLGRPYLHVFLAYAVALLLIGGWVVAIARRLARIERRLPEGE